MSSTTTLKILVTGDVEGRFEQLFKRVSIVNAKNGPFSLLLCIGEFFGADGSEWLPFKTGRAKVPIPTYILGPHSSTLNSYYPDLKGCEICEDVVYLGPSGIYRCANGLKLAYLSGMEESTVGMSFGFSEIKSLEVEVGKEKSVDVLMTSQWPKNICNFVKKPELCDPEKVGSSLISRLALRLQPRYHFVANEGVYYERLPYRNHRVLTEATRHVSRFIGLGKVNNQFKQKWLYAFNISPMSTCDPIELNKQPIDVTECPYAESDAMEPAANKNHGEKGSQFFYDMNAQSNDSRGRGRKRRGEGDEPQNKRGPPKPTGPCWFCLASPEVEKHLVVSIGSHSYLALAKGGLVQEHLLILPIAHFQSTPTLDDDCRREIEHFKTSLKKLFIKRGQVVVFFERNYRSQHLQVQVVPVPKETTNLLKDAFIDTAESSEIDLAEIPKLSDISQVAPPGSPFFYVELPNGDKLYHRIKHNFPLQFGREVLASPPLLNIPDRVDWRECKMSQEEETRVRDKLRTQFQPFDFTLDDDDDEPSVVAPNWQ